MTIKIKKSVHKQEYMNYDFIANRQSPSDTYAQVLSYHRHLAISNLYRMTVKLG